jgi:pyoverdine/dityrosine biosynthesis protein Dit1
MKCLSLTVIGLCAALFLNPYSIIAAEHLKMEMRDHLPSQVRYYLDCLPKIDRTLSDSSLTEKAKGVVRFVSRFFPITRTSQHIKAHLKGADGLVDKILSYMLNQRRIILSLPAFPFKSLNAERKVLSQQADMAEFVGILTLNHICCEIGIIYAPGARIHIFSDGLAFREVLPITADEYHAYKASLIKLIAPFSERLHFITPSEHDYRLFLLMDKDIPVQMNPDKIAPMTIFAREEMKCSRYMKWKDTRPISAEILGFLLALHSEMYQRFLKKTIPGYEKMIRLSVHPYEDISQKWGISLIYGSMGTPWHNVLVMDNQTVFLRKLKDLPNNHYRSLNGRDLRNLVNPHLVRNLILSYLSMLLTQPIHYVMFLAMHIDPLQTITIADVKLHYAYCPSFLIRGNTAIRRHTK